MDFLYNSFQALLQAGAYVMLPLIITVVGVVYNGPKNLDH